MAANPPDNDTALKADYSHAPDIKYGADFQIGSVVSVACGWIRDNVDGNFVEDNHVEDWITGANGRVDSTYNFNGGTLGITRVG